jgi:transcriptional regulator with XRE-family HTH domain
VTVQYQKPDPLPPVGNWRSDFTEAQWHEWVFGAKASQLREFCAWGRRVLTSDAPVGFPHQEPVPAPPSPAAPAAPAVQVISRKYVRWAHHSRTPRALMETAPPPADLSGAALRALREARGIGQRTVAARLGVAKSVVQLVETDRRHNLPFRERLAELYATLPESGRRCRYCGEQIMARNGRWTTRVACEARPCQEQRERQKATEYNARRRAKVRA